MYMIFFLVLSLIFSSFSYLLTPFQSIFLLIVSGLVLIYLMMEWNAKNKFKLNATTFLFFALVIAISQLFYEVNLLFVYYNIWTMISAISVVFIYKVLYREKRLETVEAEVEVEVEKKVNSSAPIFTGKSSHIFDGEFVEEMGIYVSKNEKEMIEQKNEYEQHELEFNEILGLDISRDTMSDMLYKLRAEIIKKEKEIENLLKNLEHVFMNMNDYKNEKLRLSEDFESVIEERQFYIDQAITNEEIYLKEKNRAEKALEKALENAKASKEEAIRYKNKNIELKNLIDEKNQLKIEEISSKRLEIKKRWKILFGDFNIRSRVYKEMSKYPSLDILYIELALHKLSLSDDPKSLSINKYRGTKGKTSFEHMGVEQTDVPYRIKYSIVNKGKMKIDIDDIFKHSEKKYS